ncbi:hypothetical protein DPMN_188370 [Dreissena polymorpha]|uniref:Uncharacterized protein n=1 Tax=Dreissena polymorpha TaxID=45954 RepID=A0A9D4DTA1_DREPO|nr:hypothetical protein DPMN_188370 [Dreissena polymorpha]
MEFLAVEDSETKRQRMPPWQIGPSQIVLNALVRDNWSLLFGEYKGIGAENISVIRINKWDEVVSKISL